MPYIPSPLGDMPTSPPGDMPDTPPSPDDIPNTPPPSPSFEHGQAIDPPSSREVVKVHVDSHPGIGFLITSSSITANDKVELSYLDASIAATVRNSSCPSTHRFLSALAKVIRQEGHLMPWYLAAAMYNDIRLFPKLLFSETTDEHVAELIHLYIVRLSTDHRAHLKDIRTVHFLPYLVLLAIGSPQSGFRSDNDDQTIRFRWIVGTCVNRWSIDQSAICCWIFSQHPFPSGKWEDLVNSVRLSEKSQQISEERLVEACGNLLHELPGSFDNTFKRWLIAYTDVCLVEWVFSACILCVYGSQT